MQCNMQAGMGNLVVGSCRWQGMLYLAPIPSTRLRRLDWAFAAVHIYIPQRKDQTSRSVALVSDRCAVELVASLKQVEQRSHVLS